MLQIQSQLSTLLVGIIQLNKDLKEVYNYMTNLSSIYPQLPYPQWI